MKKGMTTNKINWLIMLTLITVFGFTGCLSHAKRLERSLEKTVYREISVTQLGNAIRSVTTEGRGFKVRAYVASRGYGDFRIGNTKSSDSDFGFRMPNSIKVNSYYIERKNPNIRRQLEEDRQYTVYIAVIKTISDEGKLSYEGYIYKIEGLRSVAVVEAAELARETAREEAEQRARNEANRYDASKFTVVPSNFSPADYTRVDLFDAVATVERMLRGIPGTFDEFLNVKRFASNVVFVGQNGTDILFKTSDGAISQYMKINSRSGLTSNQNIRIYYTVSKNPLAVWTVNAIERL